MLTLPNLLAGVRDFYIAHADVAALVAGRVHALRMPPSPVFPLVLLSDVVETPLVADTDKAAQSRIQVEAYGKDAHDEAVAWQVAATCHAALHDLASKSGFTGARTVTGLQLLPDVQLGKARVIFESRVFGYTPR